MGSARLPFEGRGRLVLGHQEMDEEPGPKHIHSSPSSLLDRNLHTYTYSIMERKQHVWYRERQTKNAALRQKLVE